MKSFKRKTDIFFATTQKYVYFFLTVAFLGIKEVDLPKGVKSLFGCSLQLGTTVRKIPNTIITVLHYSFDLTFN